MAAVLALPTASVATPDATSTVTVPSADGVIVATYTVEDELENAVTDPPPTVTSDEAKLVVASEKVIVTAMVDPVAGFDALVVICTVGEVPSYVHWKLLEAVLLFPAESENAPWLTDVVVKPSALGVNVAV